MLQQKSRQSFTMTIKKWICGNHQGVNLLFCEQPNHCLKFDRRSGLKSNELLTHALCGSRQVFDLGVNARSVRVE